MMSFNNAMQGLRPGDAVKHESWSGYVTRMDADGSTYESPLYDVVVVQRDGTKYVYPFGSGSAPSPCELSPALLSAILSDNWIRGSVDEFEKARTGAAGAF